LRRFILCLLLVFACCFVFPQTQPEPQPCPFRISLLTATPGAELYSTFGHSALRVTDSSSGYDIIYNYGTFDFNDPDFYSKFMRGKLLYFVSVDLFPNYLEQYAWEKRGITEQVLNLSCEQKVDLLAFLQENAKEENKYYKYDFVRDNCTTRLRDIVFTMSNGKRQTGNVRPGKKVSFRDLIHVYLDHSHQNWSKLGIDILLGVPLDKSLTNEEAMFLPDYLMAAFDSTHVNGQALVEKKEVILPPAMSAGKKPLFTPFIVFSLLIIGIASLMIVGKSKRFLLAFDFVLFFLTGLIGWFIMFMWFGTEHLTTKNNFNLAWAFPLNFIAAFFVYKQKNWLRAYFLVYCLLLIALLILWWWGPQEMNDALLPLVILLFIRAFSHYRRA